MGAFSHSANYYVVYPGNTPKNHPPTEACMINSKQRRGCRVQDPGTRGNRFWKTANFSHSTGTAHGAPSSTSLVNDRVGQERGLEQSC